MHDNNETDSTTKPQLNYDTATALLTGPKVKLTGSQRRACHRARAIYHEADQPTKSQSRPKTPFKHTPIDRLYRSVRRCDKRLRGLQHAVRRLATPFLRQRLVNELMVPLQAIRQDALDEIAIREAMIIQLAESKKTQAPS
jgi:hypothetical protein